MITLKFRNLKFLQQVVAKAKPSSNEPAAPDEE
jgi:hypothetical protein